MPKKAPKRPPERPKTTPKRPQDDQKSDPERQDDKRTEPRRFQDRLGRPQGAGAPLSAHPQGSIWEAKSAPKRNQKRSKNEAKNQESKKPIQDDLGPVLGRSWVVLGALLGPWKRSKHYACRCFVKIHVFEKKRCQEVTWTDLVSIWEAKRVQNGRRGGSESEMR